MPIFSSVNEQRGKECHTHRHNALIIRRRDRKILWSKVTRIEQGRKRQSKAQKLGTVREKEKLDFVSSRVPAQLSSEGRSQVVCQLHLLKWRNIETIPRFLAK